LLIWSISFDRICVRIDLFTSILRFEMPELFTIKILEGYGAGTVFMLPTEGEIVIGRHSKCFIRVSEDEISRRQARLIRNNEHWIIEPISESIYTFLQNESLFEPRKLHHEDKITVGKTTMEFEVAKID
jgi:pSer/pThr/pTyr-binding forkhead associated (FHA) protein